MADKLGFICFYGSARFEVYAVSLFAAKQAAVAHFQQGRRGKIKEHMVSVVLAEKNGETVLQSTCL